MKVRITARHQKLSPSVRSYIEEKLERLDRYHDHIIDCEVIADIEKNNEIIEINAAVHNKILNVKVKDPDVTKATDLCLDKLEAQLKKFNAKIKAHPRVKMSRLLAETEEE